MKRKNNKSWKRLAKALLLAPKANQLYCIESKQQTQKLIEQNEAIIELLKQIYSIALKTTTFQTRSVSD